MLFNLCKLMNNRIFTGKISTDINTFYAFGESGKVNSLNKYLMSNYYGPDIVLGSEGTVINRIKKSPALI